MKKSILLVVLTAFFLSLAAPVQAECKGGQCALKHGKSHGDCCGSKGDCGKCGEKGGGCPIAEKFMTKAHFFLDNQKEIGLSEDQVNQIKKMKVDMKKNAINGKAAHEIFGLELEQHLSQPKINLEAVNSFIDQSMAAMTQGAKDSVAAYAALKGVLTEDQMKTAKQIWQSKK